MSYKNLEAANTTITRNLAEMDSQTGNIYEAINIIAKRANQISTEIKDELNEKLSEFATTSDNLEEVFENREQIEISKFYENQPKANALAMAEFLNKDIYFRKPEEDLEK